MLSKLYRTASWMLAVFALGAAVDAQVIVDDKDFNAAVAAAAAVEHVEAEVSPWAPKLFQDGRVLDVGGFTVENPLARGGLEALAADKKALVWRAFMRGIPDFDGYIIPWQLLIENEGKNAAYLDDSAEIKMEFKKSALPAVKLGAGKKIALPLPVFDGEKISSLKGKTVRFFIWIKGENTGLGVDLNSGAPAVALTAFDGNGEVVAKAVSAFMTRGTFPWFCYHVDIAIPDEYAKDGEVAVETEKKDVEAEDEDVIEAGSTLKMLASNIAGVDMDAKEEVIDEVKPAGLYVTLSNPSSGTAWFSTLSWLTIPAEEAAVLSNGKDASRDPLTGSLAPNPDYDELPMHLFYGLPEKSAWTFFKGNKAFGDLTKKANIVKYIDDVKDDWMHMIHAVPYLVSICNVGRKTGVFAEFEPGWETAVLDKIESLQDKKTGLWTVDGVPNLFVTQKIIENCYGLKNQIHADQFVFENTWKGIAGRALPKADLIIDSVAGAAVDFADGSIWNGFCFQKNFEDTNINEYGCDMSVTAAASRILSCAKVYASDDKQAVAEAALKSSYNYVMKNMVEKGGSWKENSRDVTIAGKGHLLTFLDSVAMLEFRRGIGLNKIDAKGTLSYNRLTVTWNASEPYVALRVFAAPAGVAPEMLTEKELVAIIQPQTSAITGMDPLLAVKNIVDSSLENRVAPGEVGADYIASKLMNTAKVVSVVATSENATVSIPQKNVPLNIYVAGVTAYGEMSPFSELSVTLAAVVGE